MAFPYDFFNFELYNGRRLTLNYVLKDPALSTVSVTDAKVQARVDQTITIEDTYFTTLITAAVNAAENYMRRDLINKNYYAFMDRFPTGYCSGIQIERSKLQAITAIQYLVGGVFQTLSSSTYYFTNDADYASIFLFPNNFWPNNLDRVRQAVRFTFTAGYGALATDVPAEIKMGLLNHVVFMYQQRGDSGDAGFTSSIPQLSLDIYNQFKIYALGYNTYL